MKENQIKKIRVKVKEKPVQFWVTIGCFALLALLICIGMLTQSANAGRISKEQKTVLLEEAGALRSDMESEMKVLKEQLDRKKEEVTEIDTMLQELSKEFESSLDAYSISQISATTEYLEQVKENIKNSEKLIESIKNTLQSNQENTASLLESQMKELNEKIQSVQKEYNSSSAEIKTLMEYMDKQNQEDKEEILEKLKAAAAELEKGSDKQISEAMKTLQDLSAKHSTELWEQIKKQYETLDADLGSRYDAISSELGSKYDSLNTDLGSKYDSMNTDLGSKYDSLNTDLGSKYNSLNTDLGSKYDSLNADIGSKYETLNETLGSKYDSINNSISEQYSTLTNHFSEKQNLIQTNMDTLFQDMNSSNNQYFQQILSDMGNGNQNLQTYLEQQFGQMDGKFNQVFQSVSSGKSNLASALLTKGVEIPQDASFEQIKEGILAIPQTIYVGSETEYLPGTISYEYHHHVNAEGNQTGDESYRGEAGGCFTNPVYHFHTSDCYETYTYTDYRNEPVDWYWTSSHTHGNSYTGVPDHCRSCSYCGACEIYGGHRNHSKQVEYTATGQRLSCTRGEGQDIENYTTGCGLSEGQIIGAHIIYQ